MRRKLYATIALTLVMAQSSAQSTAAGTPGAQTAASPAATAVRTEFTPGQPWLDNNGKHINAHGGGILKHGDKYYWYGENRPDRGFSTRAGVEVFSSTDLLNWTDEGVALPVTHTEGDDIEDGCIMERPKVAYCPKTGKFVMLFHLELKDRGYEAARVAFAESDTPTGPFRYIRSLRPNAGVWPSGMKAKDIKAAKKLRPEAHKDWWTDEWRADIAKGMFLSRDLEGGQMSRDMTLYVDDDGKAYHIYSSEDNLTLQIAELTDDFLDYTGRYIRVAPGGQNEAPTIFKRGGRYWMIASGCTGWDPNEARMFTATDIMGEWEQRPSPFEGEGAPHRNGEARKNFGTQGTYVLPLDGGKYVFMADIWKPQSLSQSGHVWLPIEFKTDGTPVIRWKDNWKLDKE